MSKGGKSFHPKKDSVTIAVIAAVAVAIVVGTVVNITVPRNVFPSEVVNPSRSGNVIIPENAADPNGNASFSPREITVVLGVNNTIIWENRSVDPERVIGAEEGMPGGFDDVKGLIPPGGSWAFTFTEAGTYDYLSDIHPWLTGTVIVKGMDSGIKAEPKLQPTVYYGFDNVGGNIPCIETGGAETPMIKTYAENTMGPDAVVDFIVSAKNADVSIDPSVGFKPGSNRTIVVLEGTAYYPQTFYLRPVPDADYVSLTLEATAVSPTDTNLVWTLPFSNTVVFYKDQSGNYCREVHDSEEQQDREEIERSKPQVDFTLFTTGNYPCIMTENVSTPSYKVAVGNPSESDIIVDFVVSARNADVSWDESAGFNQSSTRRITVLAGTPDQNQMETFYIRPHSGTDNLSLSMDARAVEPIDAPVYTYDQKVIAYFKNDAGNYCH